MSFTDQFGESGLSRPHGIRVEGDEDVDPRWYLVRLKPGGFDRARLNLERQSIRTFMPQREVTERRNRRLVMRRKPLFPGYLFVQLDGAATDCRRVNSTYGVMCVVSLGPEGPTPVAQGIMEDLFARTTSSGLIGSLTDFGIGDRVRLIAGPLAQRLGKIDDLSDGERIYVLLDIMGQSVRARVGIEALQPI